MLKTRISLLLSGGQNNNIILVYARESPRNSASFHKLGNMREKVNSR